MVDGKVRRVNEFGDALQKLIISLSTKSRSKKEERKKEVGVCITRGFFLSRTHSPFFTGDIHR
jgi:hypothetical protein